MTLYFDMDGTIADLYGVENWLAYLQEKNTFPYENARPLVNMASLARILNRLQKQGYEIGIISWLAKNSTENYDNAVTEAKKNWIKKHMPSVKFDIIHIVKYGTPKENFSDSVLDILFDDEEKNCINWSGIAYNPENMMEVLKAL